MKKLRLDLSLVARGLVPTRSEAQALVMAGRVKLDGQPATKAGHPVGPEQLIELSSPPHPYVSRGGLKLAAALDAFGIAVPGLVALDLGASTGGFTHCLLLRGALRVHAVDVGRGQLDARLRSNPAVVLHEGMNARYLAPEDVGEAVSLAVIDLAFISVGKVLPALTRLLAAGASTIVLVKPQFELGRSEVGRGVVREPQKHARAILKVAAEAAEVGLMPWGLVPSPITGARGNREFLLALRAEPGWSQAELEARAAQAAASATAPAAAQAGLEREADRQG